MMNIQFKHRYLSILQISRAFKHWKTNPEYKTPLKYHMDKQKLILGKEFKKKRWRDQLEKRRARKTDEEGVAASLYVLSNGCQGMGRSVLLQTNTERYLFNCGEGSQKYIYDVVNNIDTVDNIFFTYNCWDNVGGFIGLFLTNAHHTNRKKKTVLHGPPHVADTLRMVDDFSSSFNHVTPQYELRGFEDKGYEDDTVVVDYVQLQSDKSCDIKRQHSDSSDTQHSNNKDMNPARRCVNNDKTVMAYIVQMKAMQGRNRMLENLDDLDLGEVNKKTEDVVGLASKTEVQSYRNKDQNKQLGPIVILDIPSFEYMESFLTNKDFINFETKYKQPPHMIVHMAPLEIVEDQCYKDFMTRFEKGTVHLMLNEKCVGPVVHGSQELGLMYHKLHPEIFPHLHGLHHLSSRHDVLSGHTVQGVYSLQYTFRPQGRSNFQWEEVLDLNLHQSGLERAKYNAGREAWLITRRSQDKDEIERWSKFEGSQIDDELVKLKATLAESDTAEDLSEEYPELIFLGTGSSLPSHRRNCSCILVQMRKDEYIMLDCGEGSLIQMYQMFGEDKTQHILFHLKAVFLSHLHYDHHGGFFGILEARNKLMRTVGDVTPLMVMAHTSIGRWFHLYSNRVLGQEAAIRLFHTNKLFDCIKKGYSDENMHIVRKELNLDELVPVAVRHSPSSHGLVMKHQDGWKLTYSGDCQPSSALIRYGIDSDILIHEGTLADIFSDIAKEKKHCTTSQAIQVAEKMRAKFTMLTHFSQRMRIPDIIDRSTQNIGVAFDFMQVRPSQLSLLPFFQPVLQTLYGANIAYGYIRFTHFSAKFTDEYESLIKQTAVHDHLKQQENHKQKQELHRKLWSKNSTQFKRNLTLSEQSNTGYCSDVDVDLDGGDTMESDDTVICDANNTSDTNSNFQFTHGRKKVLIDNLLLKKLKKK